MLLNTSDRSHRTMGIIIKGLKETKDLRPPGILSSDFVESPYREADRTHMNIPGGKMPVPQQFSLTTLF